MENNKKNIPRSNIRCFIGYLKWVESGKKIVVGGMHDGFCPFPAFFLASSNVIKTYHLSEGSASLRPNYSIFTKPEF